LPVVFGRNNQKTEGFAIFSGMPGMVDIVGIYHSIEVAGPVFGSPFYSLMHDKIMENQIEQSIKKNAQSNRKQIWISVMNGKHKQSDGRNAENQSEKIVFFYNMIVNGMVRLMPAPKKAVHNKFV